MFNPDRCPSFPVKVGGTPSGGGVAATQPGNAVTGVKPGVNTPTGSPRYSRSALRKIRERFPIYDSGGRKTAVWDPLPRFRRCKTPRLTRDHPDFSNPFSTLYGLDCTDAYPGRRNNKRQMKPEGECARLSVNRRKARKIVKLLEVDQSLKAQSRLPSRVPCGSLRKSIRSIYAPELTLVQELSIKTSAKAEGNPCKSCKDLDLHRIDSWKNARLSPLECSEEHLSRFGRAFSANVPKGWNKRKTPYIPNGASSLFANRREGGNWTEQPFSAEAKVCSVYSSGKPRIVTLYSSHNVSVLTPLHHSLYSYLKGRNWLLVGSPTDERLRYLQSGCKGTKWLSFDYESATDNIKTMYVQRMVEELIDKGEGLSEDEVRCLRVVSNLSFEGGDACSGQPMGSPMSFPLLCLINKTVVDLALTDLLIKGEIPIKEWSGHRCLINGDDLLTRDTSSGCLISAIARNGASCGLRVNTEKTMSDTEIGEINSTCFVNCVKQKKTNVSSLFMKAEVADSLGFAEESTTTLRGFRMVASNNASRLARQKIKTVARLPSSRLVAVMSTKALRDAVASSPTSRVPQGTNLFPVEIVPDDLRIPRWIQEDAVSQRVCEIREKELWQPLFSEKAGLVEARRKVQTAREAIPLRRVWARLKHKKTTPRNVVMTCVARRWEKERKDALLADDGGVLHHQDVIVSDLSGVNRMVDAIKAWKENRRIGILESGPIPSAPSGSAVFSNDADYVSLD